MIIITHPPAPPPPPRVGVDKILDNIRSKIGSTPDIILDALGWSGSEGTYYDGKVSVIITNQTDFSIREKNSDVAPSYTAITQLEKSQWVILTNGTKWRLYTNKISASSTNYFELNLDSKNDIITRYLIALFGAASYHAEKGEADIDVFFEKSRLYAKDLEENLSTQIMSADGLFP